MWIIDELINRILNRFVCIGGKAAGRLDNRRMAQLLFCAICLVIKTVFFWQTRQISKRKKRKKALKKDSCRRNLGGYPTFLG